MSYATIEEANKYIKEEYWTSLSDIEKQEILDLATEMIDLSLSTISCGRVEGQESIFPLNNQTVVPRQIVMACIYESASIAAGQQDSQIARASLGIKSESTNTASISYDTKSNNKYAQFGYLGSKIAIDMIYPFLPKTAVSGVNQAYVWNAKYICNRK